MPTSYYVTALPSVQTKCFGSQKGRCYTSSRNISYISIPDRSSSSCISKSFRTCMKTSNVSFPATGCEPRRPCVRRPGIPRRWCTTEQYRPRTLPKSEMTQVLQTPPSPTEPSRQIKKEKMDAVVRPESSNSKKEKEVKKEKKHKFKTTAQSESGQLVPSKKAKKTEETKLKGKVEATNTKRKGAKKRKRMEMEESSTMTESSARVEEINIKHSTNKPVKICNGYGNFPPSIYWQPQPTPENVCTTCGIPRNQRFAIQQCGTCGAPKQYPFQPKYQIPAARSVTPVPPSIRGYCGLDSSMPHRRQSCDLTMNAPRCGACGNFRSILRKTSTITTPSNVSCYYKQYQPELPNFSSYSLNTTGNYIPGRSSILKSCQRPVDIHKTPSPLIERMSRNSLMSRHRCERSVSFGNATVLVRPHSTQLASTHE